MPDAAQLKKYCRWRPTSGFELAGKPIYIVGVNYTSKHACTNFWKDWRPEVLAEDLAQIAVLGLNAVRIPIHWEYAEPSPGKFNPDMFERTAAFMEMAGERSLLVMPWFLVGVATQDYDVSWRGQRSFFDEFMTSAAENHLKTMVGHLARHPNILCWDICDEPEWYSRHPGAKPLPYDTNYFHRWADRMYQAIKEIDPERAVTLGYGHIATGNYGIDIRQAAQQLDVMGVTAYPPFIAEDLLHGFRSSYFVGWSDRINDCANKGVFTCEAPGYSDIDASESSIGNYYRVCLMSSYMNGSMGVMPWVWSDFDDSLQCSPPLDKYTIEKRFGITRADGSLKSAGVELQEFASFIREFPPSEWQTIIPEAGVIAPVQDTAVLHQEFYTLFHHYVLLRQAHLRIRYVWPEDLSAFQGRMLFLPSSDSIPLTTPQWIILRDWVEKGGMLVSSSPHFCSIFNELFGIEVEGKQKAREQIVLHSKDQSFAACDNVVLPKGGTFCTVAPTQASVMVSEQDGVPFVTRNMMGEGQTFFVAYALERSVVDIAAEELSGHGACTIFQAIASIAGLACHVVCPDPRIELDVRQHADGRLLAIMINHSRFPTTTSLRHTQTVREKPIELPGSGVGWEIIKPQ